MQRSIVLLLAVLLTAAPTVATGQDLGDQALLAGMAREHAGDTPMASPAAEAPAAAEVIGAEVTYAELDGTAVTGYLSRPAEATPTAAILLIHEWWGLNDNVRAMADRFAGEGYLALAVDLYEGEAAADRDDAMRLMRASMDRGARLEENLRQAAAWLASEHGIERLGSVGWCFGGGWSLRAGLLLGDDLDAAVMYYGRPVTDRDELAALEAPLLGHFGALDSGIPLDSVRALESALEALGKAATIHVYDDAGHAFANPSGSRYQPEAAEASWERTLAFFGQHLR